MNNLIKLKGEYGVRLKGTNIIYSEALVSKENADKFEVLDSDPNAEILPQEETPIVIEEESIEQNG